jgi:hypothetical protein
MVELMQVNRRFRFKGEEVEDTVLFFWSTVSISRALRFNAEAQHQRATSCVMATVAAYYSMFHLGMFLLYSAPHIMDSALRAKIDNALSDGGQDPRRAVSHSAVSKFLHACQSHGLPSTIVDLFEKARTLREFANYGPDLQSTTEGFQVFNRSHNPQEASLVIDRLNDAFFEAVEWASQGESESRLFVPIALSIAADYFLPNEYGAPYYSEWSSPNVLSAAEALRGSLEQKSQELVYPKNDSQHTPPADG